MLSLISILTIFVILGVCAVSQGLAVIAHHLYPFGRLLSKTQVSAMQSRRSSDNMLFVRTHVAKYFVSLLMCNVLQSIGGLLNISFIIENRVHTGVACTVQGFLKQLGNVRRFIDHYG